MKRLIFILMALLLAGSAFGAEKLQIMEAGKIKLEFLPTTDFSVSEDPASPTDGQIWWNETTKQLKIADAEGVYSFNGTLTDWDTTPEAFSFDDIVNATTSALYTSAAITVSGINHPAAISVSGDASAKYSVNNATATATNGTVEAGDEVRAVVTSSADADTAVNATVLIGGVSDVFSVATAAAEEPVTYLIDEDFEGTGAPSGWEPVYGSHSGLAVVDYDATDTVLAGTQSLKLGASSDNGYSVLGSPAFEGKSTGTTATFLWMPYRTVDNRIFEIRSSTGTALAILDGNSISKFILKSNGASDVVSSVSIVADSTVYTLKVEYIPGIGNNAIARAYYYSGGDWVLLAQITTGTSTETAATVRIKSGSVLVGSAVYFDNVQVQ